MGSPSRTTQTTERERKWVVDEIPTHIAESLGPGVVMRQGYLNTDGDASVRLRDAGPEGRTLTIKSGGSTSRIEVEWEATAEQFDALWPLTAGRRIEKTRHRVDHGDHVIELDVFAGSLRGLLYAEVEFDADEALRSFVAPDWFGREVSDDKRYNNSSLAAYGRPVNDPTS